MQGSMLAQDQTEGEEVGHGPMKPRRLVPAIPAARDDLYAAASDDHLRRRLRVAAGTCSSLRSVEGEELAARLAYGRHLTTPLI